jgi:hypothetical protein
MPHASMGLLALAACLGMESKSNNHCFWCRCTAAQLKAIPNVQGAVTCPLCKPESQVEDLAATAVAKDAAVAKGIKAMSPAVNGAVAKQLLPITRGQMLPPYLHLLLGLPNGVMKEIRKNFLKLGSVDPEAAKTLLVLNALLADLDEVVEAAANALAEVVDTPGTDGELWALTYSATGSMRYIVSFPLCSKYGLSVLVLLRSWWGRTAASSSASTTEF